MKDAIGQEGLAGDTVAYADHLGLSPRLVLRTTPQRIVIYQKFNQSSEAFVRPENVINITSNLAAMSQ